MALVSLTVRQIRSFGIWDKVCEYKGWSPYILNEGQISNDEIVEFDDEFKKEETPRKEYHVGDKFERKDFEYEIVAKVKHETKDTHVYMVKRRAFGQDEVSYEVFEEFTFSSYNKIS